MIMMIIKRLPFDACEKSACRLRRLAIHPPWLLERVDEVTILLQFRAIA